MMIKTDTEKALDKRFPEAVSLIVTRSVEGQINVCTVGYFSLASFTPKTWAISVYREHSTNKFIKDTKEFVLCLPSVAQIEDLMIAGSIRFDENKMNKLNFKFLNTSSSKIPIIEGSIACFVCKVIEQTNVGDHTTFFGQITDSYDSDLDWKEKIYNWDDKKLGNIKYGDEYEIMNFSPEGAVKSK